MSAQKRTQRLRQAERQVAESLAREALDALQQRRLADPQWVAEKARSMLEQVSWDCRIDEAVESDTATDRHDDLSHQWDRTQRLQDLRDYHAGRRFVEVATGLLSDLWDDLACVCGLLESTDDDSLVWLPEEPQQAPAGQLSAGDSRHGQGLTLAAGLCDCGLCRDSAVVAEAELNALLWPTRRALKPLLTEGLPSDF